MNKKTSQEFDKINRAIKSKLNTKKSQRGIHWLRKLYILKKLNYQYIIRKKIKIDSFWLSTFPPRDYLKKLQLALHAEISTPKKFQNYNKFSHLLSNFLSAWKSFLLHSFYAMALHSIPKFDYYSKYSF